MKALFTFLVLLILHGSLTAVSSQTIFLFEEFIPAKVHFKNHSVTQTPLNYDAEKGRMLFIKDSEIMELVNVHMIDSISFGKRQFIPFNGRYLEKMKTENGIVFINWNLRNVKVGPKGAYGMPTQGKVESLMLYDEMGVVGSHNTMNDKQSTDINRRKNANTYFIQKDGKFQQIKNLKQLIKLFPDKEEMIRQYASEKNLKMQDVAGAVTLIDYCLSL